MAAHEEMLSTETRSTYSQPYMARSHRTTSEALRSKKLAVANAKAIQNRIAYFKREETKIWRDLEEVRRQTGKIEDGRARVTEKKIANHSILQQREQMYYQKRLKAVERKNERDIARTLQEDEALTRKKAYGEDRRRESMEILEQKRMTHQQTRLRNSERAMIVQRAHLDAKMRINDDKQQRLAALHEEAEKTRMDAAREVEQIESLLPSLEEEEMACLQRLQNSRLVSQNVLQELEASLGRESSVSSVIRLRGTTVRSNSFRPPDRSSTEEPPLTSIVEEPDSGARAIYQ